MNKSFEEYMQEIHAEDYKGTKDDMIEDFENWVCDLDADSWLMYGRHYGNSIKREIVKPLNKLALDLLQ